MLLIRHDGREAPATGYPGRPQKSPPGWVLVRLNDTDAPRVRVVQNDEGKNEVQKPSFTLYPYGGLVIDYVPGSGEQQKDELMRREQVYRYNQIPAVLLGPKDLTESNWQDVLYKRIQRAYRQEFDPMQYAPEPIEK